MTTITTNIKLIETDSEFLEKVSHKVNIGDKSYYHIPFWYRKISEGVYEEIPFYKLPKELTDFIQEERDGNTYKPASCM